MAFSSGVDDVLFPVDISQDAHGGPAFHTTIVTSASGYEQRNQDFTAARLRWDIGHIMDQQSTIDTLIAFYRARGGKARGFRFRDWSDYYVGMAYNSASVLVPATPQQFATGDGATTVFQLTKTYPDALNPVVRRITRPVSGSVLIYFGAALQSSGFTIDSTTGLVNFATAPGAGTVINWSGEFDVPVRFDTDDMKFSLHHVELGDWQSLQIIELLE